MLVDSHAHLDSPEFSDAVDEIIDRARRAGVSHILTIGCVTENLQAIARGLRLVEQYNHIFVALGVHPHDAGGYSAKIGRKISRTMNHPKVIGWGEIGLDYYYQNSDAESQITCFRSQLELALQAEKPVIIHSRGAAEPTCSILEEYAPDGLEGVMHCFTYDQRTADRCLNFGFYLSFGGIVTFSKAEEIQSIARQTPSDRYLVETDSPYLAPVPFRGRTNQPAYVAKVAEKLAQLRGIDVDTVARESSQNFERLFGIG